MAKRVEVGLLGLGVVGSELARMILQNKERLSKEYDIELVLKKIFVRDLKKERNVEINPDLLTISHEEISQDPDISIICECMGGSGTQETRVILQNSIQAGKHLVLSSKKVLAKYAEEILAALKENAVDIRFDATVGGGIPVTKVLKECFKGEQIKKIVGIFNATSNFIYTHMQEKNQDFQQALQLAQKMGYAENDPSEDIKGYDALYKLIILTIFGMGKMVDIQKLEINSFEEISLVDMRYAKELGYQIKPLALVEERDGTLFYRVGPSLIQESHVIASAVKNYNVIMLDGESTGSIGLHGQGAGAKPTAAAMFDDLVGILRESEGMIQEHKRAKIQPVTQYAQYTNNLYWRYTAENKIGVLAKICTVFLENGINIEKLIQKDELNKKMDIVVLTHSADKITIDKVIHELTDASVDVVRVIPFF